MALEGSLEVFTLSEILQMVAVQKKTGILTVQGESDIVAVSFLNGQVVAADALNQTVEEGLGQVLSQMQLVKPEDFAAVAAEHQAGGGRMVDLLQQRGYVERPQLLRALRTQTYGLLMQLLDWKRGDFKFYGGDEVSYEDGFEPITVEEVLSRGGAGSAVSGAEPAATVGELSVFSRVSPPPERVRVLDESHQGGPREGSGIWVSREEKLVLDRLDGRRNIEDIARDTRLSTQRVLHALERLQQAGLAQGAHAAPAPVPPGTAPRPAAQAGPPPRPAPPAKPAAVVPAGPPARAAAPPPAVAAPAPRRGPASPKPPAEALNLGPMALEPPSFAARPGLDDSQSRAPRPRPVAVPVSAPPEARANREPVPAWPGIALATGLLILVLVVSSGRPGLLVLPYPWQESSREALEKAQRSALYFKIDRAAKTFFLLEGRYPDDLGQLADLRLLGAEDYRDPRGRPLAYAIEDLSYTLEPVEGGEPLTDLGRREAVTGDFLLDAEFTKLPSHSDTQALVLLD